MDDTMTDDEICEELGFEPSINDTGRRARAASHSRFIYSSTGEWPWEWADDFPPQRWTANMVQNLARIYRHYERGPCWWRSEYNSEGIKLYVEGQVKLRGRHAPLKPNDITRASLYFGITKKRRKSTAEEDESDVDVFMGEEEQHGYQTNTSSKANAPPNPTPNGESSVLIHQRLARQTKSSPPEEVITLDQSETSLSDSPKKRARSEEAYLGPTIAALDRPTKRRHLNTDESNTDHDLSAPTVEDPAVPMTKEKDLATLDAVVKRRRTESTLEYTTLKEKVDTFQNDLNNRKASLEAGTVIASESRNEVATCENVYHDAFNNLQKLRRTIEHYEINKDLMETLDSETRVMIAKDHGRRLGEMKKELDTAETHLHEARSKVEVEREEVKKRIKDDEAKLVDMEAGLELAHTERDRWICMEHLAAMKADDLKKFVAGLEEEGLGTPKSLEKKNQPDGGIGNTDEFKVDPEFSGSD